MPGVINWRIIISQNNSIALQYKHSRLLYTADFFEPAREKKSWQNKTHEYSWGITIPKHRARFVLFFFMGVSVQYEYESWKVGNCAIVQKSVYSAFLQRCTIHNSSVVLSRHLITVAGWVHVTCGQVRKLIQKRSTWVPKPKELIWC